MNNPAAPKHSLATRLDYSLHEDTQERAKQALEQGLDDCAGYVVGCADDGFCSLLPLDGMSCADDQNLGDAMRFETFDEAFTVAWERGKSVFRVIVEDGRERIEELLIDSADNKEGGQ